ncbi:hypothetical protein ACIQTN_01900 [Streptomyces werraensis]
MELAVIALALWVSYKWGQKEAYKRGFDEGVKKAKNYELEVRVKEKPNK